MNKGEDVIISQMVDIRSKCVDIGSHVAIDSFFAATTTLKIGDYVHIGPSVSIIGGGTAVCIIGNFCGIAAGCRLICASDEYQGEGIICPFVPKEYRDNVIGGKIVLNDFVTLATNSIVMPNVIFGEGSVVAAGSVVTKSTEPWMIYAGNPARAIKPRPKDKIIQYAKEMGYDRPNC